MAKVSKTKIFLTLKALIQSDKKNILYLLYFSAVEALLVLAVPLASVFVINSVLAHTSTSVYTLGIIIITVFALVIMLQFIKEYIIEKFQQKIFVKTAINISQKALELREKSDVKADIDKYMNYFFDITAIQKVFPLLLLDGTGVVLKITVSLLLLFAFNPYLFSLGFFFLAFFVVLIYVAGKNGVVSAINRSDTKHTSIYYLQHIPYDKRESEEILKEFDTHLQEYVMARVKMFNVIIRQLVTTFIMEGTIFTSFLVVGGYLVIEGKLPVGEFVAAEIVVVTVTSALKTFVKQIDYMYDIMEGLYKVEKLSETLGEKIHD